VKEQRLIEVRIKEAHTNMVALWKELLVLAPKMTPEQRTEFDRGLVALLETVRRGDDQ
jgi:hypothetical protein